MGKPGRKDSGKQISEALLAAACSMDWMVFSRVDGVSRRWGEMWAVATRRVGSGMLRFGEALPVHVARTRDVGVKMI